ncbi:MAG: hypothetical protein JOZ90_12155 [Alphaproteobacteria bacterium]|nr:hypothetical protein [Alphaproteobacteria bacterium]MBV9371362.1 hypothetical protein [Alphaproteobacteria bacterium]MBV9901826.1 hypothetical protein [Alphaproteobacteria bacterium]
MARYACLLALALALGGLGAAPARAGGGRVIASARELKPGEGAVRLSVQAQTQQWATLHVWFVRDGGDPSRPDDLWRIDRKTGVPIAGSNQIDPNPKVYALPPGRYRLLGYAVKCDSPPPEGTIGCSVSQNYTHYEAPARRYGSEGPVIEVAAGRVTDAGEFIVEAAPGSPITEKAGSDFADHNPGAFDMRLRPSTVPLPAAFAGLPAGPQVAVPPGFASNVKCLRRPKGATLYVPFDC